MATPTERRCKAATKRGERCAGRIVNADGLCTMHAGTTDPRELGRKSGRGRRGVKPERVNEGLRDYLKREVPPERVWRALELAMEGQNESARVSASRVLMDALAEPHEERDRYAEYQAETKAAVAKMDEWLPRALSTVIVRLLTTGKAYPTDAGIVQQTIDRLRQDDGWLPFFDLLKLGDELGDELRIFALSEQFNPGN